MQLENLVTQYRGLILETLQQHFGLPAVRAEAIIDDFLVRHVSGHEVQQRIAAAQSTTGQLLIEVRNHAFQYLQTPPPVPVPTTETQTETSAAPSSPRFSATGTIDAEVNWLFQQICPSLSRCSHMAENFVQWQLFESAKIRPTICGIQRPPLRYLAERLQFASLESAQQAVESQAARWNQNVLSDLQATVPNDLSGEFAERWLSERKTILREVMQRVLNASFSESEGHLRTVQRLLREMEAGGSQSEPSHLAGGLRMMESYLRERLEQWSQPRYVYDAASLLNLDAEHAPEQILETVSGSQRSTDTAEERRPHDSHAAAQGSVSGIAESVDEIILQLDTILASTLPDQSQLFDAEFLQGKVAASTPQQTVAELLFSPQPSADGLRHLKDLAKQQGPDSDQPWNLAVSKLLYFAAIAAYIVRIDRGGNASSITSLPRDELYNAFRWAESLPRLAPPLRQLLAEAWQSLERSAN